VKACTAILGHGEGDSPSAHVLDTRQGRSFLLEGRPGAWGVKKSFDKKHASKKNETERANSMAAILGKNEVGVNPDRARALGPGERGGRVFGFSFNRRTKVSASCLQKTHPLCRGFCGAES